MVLREVRSISVRIKFESISIRDRLPRGKEAVIGCRG